MLEVLGCPTNSIQQKPIVFGRVSVVKRMGEKWMGLFVYVCSVLWSSRWMCVTLSENEARIESMARCISGIGII